MFMAIPEHMGFVQKRTWHKIKWTNGQHAGKFDIFDDDDMKKHKGEVEIVETFRTDMCAAGVSYAFGKTSEETIDTWIRENRC